MAFPEYTLTSDTAFCISAKRASASLRICGQIIKTSSKFTTKYSKVFHDTINGACLKCTSLIIIFSLLLSPVSPSDVIANVFLRAEKASVPRVVGDKESKSGEDHVETNIKANIIATLLSHWTVYNAI